MARLTLEEIGRRAGVSRSTVSRVVNGHPDVSPAVQQRVLDVIEETGFRPNQAARALVSSRSGLIGLVIPSTVHSLFTDPYFGRLIQGITHAANGAGQMLTLFLFEDRSQELDFHARVVANGLIDGLIVTATRIREPLLETMRTAAAPPIVMIGRSEYDDVPYVDVENRAGARAATEHLVSHGRRALATVAAPADTAAGIDRLAGFRDATAAAGLDVPDDRVVEGDFTEEGGFAAALRLLETRPDAIFCASDLMALGALRAIHSRGLRCPEDVAVVGFDGLAEPSQSDPALTTVAQPVQRTGETSVHLLLEVLDGERQAAPAPSILPTQLLTRGSCGCTD